MSTVPYIITKKSFIRTIGPPVAVSRHAVATLEDDSHMDVLSEVARIMLRAGVVQQGTEWARVILRLKDGDLSPTGPLPDGTVIEVEPLREEDLTAIVDTYHVKAYTLPDAIAAFNAQNAKS